MTEQVLHEGHKASRLNYFWRIIATGWCFLSFGLGGLLLTLFAFPIIHLCYRDKNKRRKAAQIVIHKSFRLFIKQMIFLGVMVVTLKNIERLSKSGGQLLLASHPTLIDVVLLISLLPETDCIVKEALWRNPFLRGVVTAADYTSNSGDPDELMDSCKQLLDKNHSLIVFPEGTRTTPGNSMKLQRGAARIALHAKKNITPIIIHCTPPALMKNVPWYKVPNRAFHITLDVGCDIQTSEFIREELPESKQSRQLTEFLKQFYLQELSKYEPT